MSNLRPILAAYRAEVQPHWSPATAHPSFDGQEGDPAGQCGVTSAWLQRRLAEDHGIETAYCVGSMECRYHGERLSQHCWLEASDRIIIDLTSDQIACGLRLWAYHWDETDETQIRYCVGRYLSSADLLADRVQARLAILTAEVGR